MIFVPWSPLNKGFEFPEPVLNSWDLSSPSSVCSWVGIHCSRGRVSSLDLTGFNLYGSVSPEISKLDQLASVSLAGNNFSGTIELVGLSKLRFLNISNNQFNGGLDWNYTSIADLEVFDAFDNNFTAFLPLGILNLQKLRHLELGGKLFLWQNTSKLRKTSGAGVSFADGKRSSWENPSLREIYLGNFNVFEGEIPVELSNLVNLVHMDLSSCGLDGPIPNELGNLKLLHTLYLHINLLSGSIPKELGNLTNLVNLDLSLHGSIPDYVADLPNLETLQLWNNNFTGVIPRNLGRNGKLQILDLSSNKLTGTIPQDLCSSNQLRVLILFKNFLFGPIPEGLGACYSLTKVRLGQNYLNGSIPSGFIYLPELNLAEFQSNYLSGTLSENGNSSSKPVKLGQLDLSNNLFSGPLPSSLSNFSSLQTLLLSGNKFSGPIPPMMGELQNNLSGPIPSDMSNIHNLNYLNLSRNHLNQTIPKSLGSLKSLTIADFSFNDFAGKLPESGQFSLFNASSFAGNPLLCGPLLNNPCNFTTVTDTPGKAPSNFKLIFALGLLICSLIFATAALIKAKTFKKSSSDSWKLTTFQKLEFTVTDIIECVKDGNVIGRGGAGIVYHGKMPNGVEIAVKNMKLKFPSGPSFLLLVPFPVLLFPTHEYLLAALVSIGMLTFPFVFLLLKWSKRATNNRREDAMAIADPRLTMVPKEEAMHLFFIAMLCSQENSIERPTMREVVQMLSEFPRQTSPDCHRSSSSSVLPRQSKKSGEKKEMDGLSYKQDLLV
ncbi:LEUCINE-RICH REPEAT RECEPTOR-LIKE SERINE/THREONINE-PROTEIN KINASE BAM3 [Salix viminalis]|uniref:LEUCINE-RICH REPEAT RECEPTOR-LIKE SERINE/THREONINE-PROTEIN KINASE BAM3 n=1 Tax=Salix viminalis TaxID=40686 RepID=A0A9Q0YZC6_SALVM|nr:LEUCINE-RICH REPEAT RECEPTOR-LIKE SERINE/THREONINE-PROTEIN KINASE BAM3 [Salix viminalis]